MSKKSMAQPKSVAETKVARKRYTAPELEAYGTVQALTHTSYTSFDFDAGDVSTYYSSTPD